VLGETILYAGRPSTRFTTRSGFGRMPEIVRQFGLIPVELGLLSLSDIAARPSPLFGVEIEAVSSILCVFAQHS